MIYYRYRGGKKKMTKTDKVIIDENSNLKLKEMLIIVLIILVTENDLQKAIEKVFALLIAIA